MPIRPRACSVAGVLALLVAGIIGFSGAPAVAADDGLDVAIRDLTPSSLTADSTVTLSGVVTNTGSATWRDVQAYLTIRPNPLTSRSELTDALTADGFAGGRIVDAGRFVELGDMGAGSAKAFTLEVPSSELPISGTDGVYPVGVQILATSPDGDRSSTAVARATTLLPRMVGDHPAAPTTVVWTFLMPSSRAADGQLVDSDALLADMRPEGRLRRLLVLALRSDPAGRGAIVDPALVDAADDLAEGRATEGDVSEADQAVATTFRDDLVALAAAPSSWTLDYDRTDVLALASDAAVRRRLFGSVERATDSVVARHQLSDSRVSWPSRDSVNEGLTRSLRERGDAPVVVSSTQLPSWAPGDGVLLRRATSRGDLPLLVNDEVGRDLPGDTSWTTVRQQVLASAAFASLDPDDGRAALVLIDPTLDPGTTLDPGLGQSYVAPRSLDQVSAGSRYTGKLVATAAKPIGRAQLSQADSAAAAADLLSAAATDSEALDEAQAQSLADVLGIRWRSDREGGLEQARQVNRALLEQVGALTVMAPPSVTLSSNKGGFPLTISNGTDEDVAVGVRLDSSNPALDPVDQEPVEIAAGERQTITIEVDLDEQNATTLTARLTTPDGRAFGPSEEFIVRSSRVGAYLWATMGAAGLFVLLALVRRFRRRGRASSEPFGADDE